MTYWWRPCEASLPIPPPTPRPHSPAGPVGLLLWGPGWASGMASGRRPSFQGGGVLWGVGKSLSGPEGRSAASRRRTWTAEGQRVSPRAGVNGDVSPRGPAAARCSCDHRPLAGMFSHPTPSPSHLRKPSDPRAQAGPLQTCSESPYFSPRVAVTGIRQCLSE